VWIEVVYPEFDYASPVGIPNDAVGALTSYFLTEVDIDDEGPEPSREYIYGLGDWDIILKAEMDDNKQLFINWINLDLEGPYSENNKVMYYAGHTTGDYTPVALGQIVIDQGYEYEFVPDDPFVPLDTTGLKVLFIQHFESDDLEPLYTPGEIQGIRDMVNGGGVVVVVIDYPGSHGGGNLVLDTFIEDLGIQWSCPHDMTDPTAYIMTDYTPDPVTAGITEIEGWWWGRFELYGDAVSLGRGINDADVIVKSPIM